MPRPVQNRHGEVGYLPVNVPRDGTQSVGDRSVKINLPSHRGRNNQLLHVDRWPRIEHGAARRHAQHADRVRKALGGERGAIDWVNRNVQVGTGAVADLLAIEQHRRFVFLSLSDYHDTVHPNRSEHRAHGVHGSLINLFLVTKAHISRAGDGGRLSCPHQLQGEIAVRVGPVRPLEPVSSFRCWSLRS